MVKKVTVTYDITIPDSDYAHSTAGVAQIVEAIIEAGRRDILLAAGSGLAEEIHLDEVPEGDDPARYDLTTATITVHSHKEARP